jgi:hypothetical protein
VNARLNLDLRKTIYEDLARFASVEGRSISEVVRGLVVDWVSERRRNEVLNSLGAKLKTADSLLEGERNEQEKG